MILKKWWRKKFVRVISYVVSILLFIVIATLTTVDLTPKEKCAYYTETIKRLDTFQFSSFSIDRLAVGWSKKSITPNVPTDMAGYRPRGLNTEVHDSLFVRAMVFGEGVKNVAILSFDLILVHPNIVQAIDKLIEEQNIPIDFIYYSSTHTHNSFGNWSSELAGRHVMGSYEEEIVSFLAKNAIEAIKEGIRVKRKATISYAEVPLKKFVYNRLRQDGRVDTLMRVIKVAHSDEIAYLSTFAAHATSLPRKSTYLSADYPGELCNRLENQEGVGFAMYCAGAVGSHAPVLPSFTFEAIDLYTRKMTDTIIRSNQLFRIQKLTSIDYGTFTMDLRSPQLRITKGIRLRPWLFTSVMGDNKAEIKVLKLGGVVLVGTPCDFSGEYYHPINQLIDDPSKRVMISSFNGNYIGYITRDDLYDEHHHEVQQMNWYGPYNGAYFTEVIAKLVSKL